MEFKAFDKIPRLSREMVITEKIDGTNGIIAIEELPVTSPMTDPIPSDGALLEIIGGIGYGLKAGSRSRWITPGKSNDNAGFAAWVYEHAKELISGLGPGFHYGEWWGKGIQRGYGLSEKRFSLFNVARWSDPKVRPTCCHVVPTLGIVPFLTDAVDDCLEHLKKYGSLAAPGYMNPEGIVIYHTASGQLFKKTIENDEKPKGSTE